MLCNHVFIFNFNLNNYIVFNSKIYYNSNVEYHVEKL